MKILLILPPLSESGSKRLKPRFAPYITASVASQLIKESFEVRVFDAYFENASFHDVAIKISEYQPDLIGIAAAEVNREIPYSVPTGLIEYIRRQDIRSPIVIFGNKETAFLDNYLDRCDRRDGSEYFISGDPEETILDLAKIFENKEETEISKIEGLLYKSNGKKIFTGRRILRDLDRLEFPAWDVVGLDKYFVIPHRYRRLRFYPLQSSRGCKWGKCIFCQDGLSIQKGGYYRVKSPQRVAQEIVYACQKYDCKEIQFGDQHFNLDKDWLMGLESEFKKNKIRLNWSCLSRIDMVTPEILAIMRRMGCWNILFGMESSCQHCLDTMDKGISVRQIENAVKWCKNEGIEVTGSFLIGIPGEKPQCVDNTVKFALGIGVDYAQFFIAKWFQEHDRFRNLGCLTEQYDFSQYDFCGRIFIPKGYRNLAHLKRTRYRAYLRFYLHPKIILRHLRRIKTVKDFGRLFRGLQILSDLIRNRHK